MNLVSLRFQMAGWFFSPLFRLSRRPTPWRRRQKWVSAAGEGGGVWQEKPGQGASVVQARTAGPGMRPMEEELNHPSEFLEARAQGLSGAAGNSLTESLPGPRREVGWGSYTKMRNPHFLTCYLVIALQTFDVKNEPQHLLLFVQ